MKTSALLVVGDIYTRKELSDRFSITDANLKNGVFRPKNHESIWLFITENKSPDRTQYSDLLGDNLLIWDGQTQGRTDKFIIEHKVRTSL